MIIVDTVESQIAESAGEVLALVPVSVAPALRAVHYHNVISRASFFECGFDVGIFPDVVDRLIELVIAVRTVSLFKFLSINFVGHNKSMQQNGGITLRFQVVSQRPAVADLCRSEARSIRRQTAVRNSIEHQLLRSVHL